MACLELHTVKDSEHKVMWVMPEIEGQKLRMELDTGSALSIISRKDYQDEFAKVKLRRTSVTLKTYTGEEAKITISTFWRCIGKCTAKIPQST